MLALPGSESSVAIEEGLVCVERRAAVWQKNKRRAVSEGCNERCVHVV